MVLKGVKLCRTDDNDEEHTKSSAAVLTAALSAELHILSKPTENFIASI